jgi:YegS/Rv2252/BmrU family lipid kinase
MAGIKSAEILFIINPHSGKKNPEKIVRRIMRVDPTLSWVITNNPGDLENIFQKDMDKFKAIIAVGGDGTVNEISKYLINKKDKVMGVLPNGSGNGFAYELNFGSNIESLISAIRKGEIINVDVLEVNNHHCINIAGLGFDSHVAHKFQTSRRGLKNYILFTLQAVFTFKPFNATIHTSKNEINGKYQMITIANTRQFGNQALISPQSKPDDGVFEIVLVKAFPIFYFLIFIAKLYLGTLKNSRYIEYIRENESVTIESDYKKYPVDGEPLVINGPLKIRMSKNNIQIIKMSDRKKDS